jgi:hypothetical protein
MKNDKDFVKDGYQKVAKLYREQEDEGQAQIPIYYKWLHHPRNNGKILELGYL